MGYLINYESDAFKPNDPPLLDDDLEYALFEITCEAQKEDHSFNHEFGMEKLYGYVVDKTTIECYWTDREINLKFSDFPPLEQEKIIELLNKQIDHNPPDQETLF